MKKYKYFVLLALTSLCLSSDSEPREWGWILTNFPSEYSSNSGTSIGHQTFITSYDNDSCTGLVFRSDDFGETWLTASMFTNHTYLTSIISLGNEELFLMLYDCEQQRHEVLRSENFGDNWEETSPIPYIEDDNLWRHVKIWKGLNDVIYLTGSFSDIQGLHLLTSNDYGNTWIQNGLFDEEVNVLTAFSEVTPEHLIVGSSTGQIFDSFDSGQTWVIGNSTSGSTITTIEYIASERYLAGVFIIPFLLAREWNDDEWYRIAEIATVQHLFNSSRNVIYAATGGVYQSVDSGNTWAEMYVESFDSVITNIFEADDGFLYSTGGNTVYRSADPIIPPTFTPTVAPGTPTYTPHPPTFTHTPLPTYTSTTTPTPSSPTRPPQPTPECESLGISFEYPSNNFRPGDPFFLTVNICNTFRFPLVDLPLIVILELNGTFWFGPSWSSSSDHYQEEWQAGTSAFPVISEFLWPSDAGTYFGAIFWGAMTNPAITDIIGVYDRWEFGWSE